MELNLSYVVSDKNRLAAIYESIITFLMELGLIAKQMIIS